MYITGVSTQDEYLKKYMKIYISGICMYIQDEIKNNFYFQKNMCVYMIFEK